MRGGWDEQNSDSKIRILEISAVLVKGNFNFKNELWFSIGKFRPDRVLICGSILEEYGILLIHH